MTHSRGHHVVIRFWALQHRVHSFHEIGSMSPMTLCFKIPQSEFIVQSMLDSGHSASNLTRNKLEPPPRALVIEQDAITTKHVIGVAVVHRQMITGNLTDAIRATGIKRRQFVLRAL